MDYPGHVIKVGEKDAEVVKALKQQLNAVLGLANDPALRLNPEDPAFGPKMKQAVKLFQARNVDAGGHPLCQDGEVGIRTWAALFGHETVPVQDGAASPFLAKVVKIAAGEAKRGVREIPRNSNCGPDVENYQACAGSSPGTAWCCAFVYWSFDRAADSLGIANPMVRTASCMEHWRLAQKKGARRIPAAEALGDPSLVRPGMVFIIDHGGGLGHTGLVEAVRAGVLTTIEGNTDGSKTREGGGVYRLTRGLAEINKGFIDYSAQA